MNYFYGDGDPEGTPGVNLDSQDNNTNPVADVAESAAKQAGEQAKKEIQKKVTKEVGKKAATSAAGSAASASLMASLSYVLFWVALVILIIFILIGLIMFFVTMPGMVMEQLKALFKEIGNFVAAYFGANTTKQIDDNQIYDTLGYLESMGWDIKSEGFLTDYYETDEDFPDGADDENGKNLDERVGVFRDDDNNIIAAESDFIFTYIVSDNYIYTIKNGNLATQDNADNWFEAIVTGIATAIYNTLNILIGPVFDVLGINEAVSGEWGSGLLAFYYDDGVGKEGTYVNTESMWNWDSIEVDTSTKKLLITRNEFLNNNNAMEFSLDGWTGRYGMPLEFLLSVHKATMMPDLAYDMATGFPTNVNIYLHDVSGTATAAYKTRDGKYITFTELNKALTGTEAKNIFSQVWSWFDNLSQSDKEVRVASELGVDHAETCSCTEDYVEGYRIKGSGTVVYKRDDGTYYKKGTDTDGTEIEIDVDPEVDEIETTQEIQYTDICSDCKDYLSEVIHIASDNNDYNFKAYSPYIANVTDHWYRDVYFVINNEDQDFVIYDYDYQSVMHERWTLYETYTEDENSEKAGEFKLYKVNDDGSLGDLYNGTQEEANEQQIKVIKKAKTIESSDTDALLDLGWNKNTSTGIWTAYEESAGSSTGYERLFEDDQIEETGITAEVKRRMYINLETTGNIVQSGEGQRTETNDDIKKMFLKNYYFRYDGSEDVAEIITKLRKDNDLDYGAIDPDDFDKSTTIDGETYYVEDYVGNVTINQDSLNAFGMLENTHTLDSDYIYRDFKELIVELGYFTKEELTDETPRLLQFPVPEIGSAGYPYRPLDKAENEFGTMIHSRGDIEAYEKFSLRALIQAMGEGNSEAGVPNLTSVGSTVIPDDINLDDFETAEDVTGFENMRTIDITEVGAVAVRKRPSSVSLNEFLKATRDMCEEINEMGYDYCVYCDTPGEGDYRDDCSCNSFAACIEAYNRLKRYWVCNATGCPCGTNHCKHNVHGNSCGLPTTFELSKTVGPNNLCCATLVSWALQNVGVATESDHDKFGLNGAANMADFCLNELKGKQIMPGEPLKPGDILCYEGHVDICGESKNGGFVKYNGGHQVAIGSQEGGGTDSTGAGSCIEHISGWPSNATFAVRLNWGTGEDAPYEGYNGNEAVVSPVTGILLEYDTYDENDKEGTNEVEYRENVDIKYGKDEVPAALLEEETATEPVTPPVDPNNTTEPVEEEPTIDKVGYAKILVLDAKHYEILEKKLDNNWKNNSLVTIKESKNAGTTTVTSEKDTNSVHYEDVEDFNLELVDDESWSQQDITTYGYKEFAESYEYAGISGYVVYIDGFVAEKPDGSIIYDEEAGDNLDDLWGEKPNGTPLTMDSFKVSPSSLENYPETAPETLYEIDETFKLASQKATEKSEAVAAIKEMAAPAVTVNYNSEELVFIKEGTVLGRTMTDRELIEEIRKDPDPELDFDYYRPEKPEDEEEAKKVENMHKVMGNYVRIFMRDLDGTVVEDIEDYMKLDEPPPAYPPQPYVQQPGDFQILVNLIHHEGCQGYFEHLLDGDEQQAQAASRVTGYVCINRALVNYGDHGTTISDQIAAPGQYSTKDEVLNGPDVNCDYCFENAEWCLTYDCMSVSNPSGVQMERNVLSQSGWCQGCEPEFSCWWWVDSTGDGQPSEHYDGCSGYDTFFCVNERY